MTDHMSQTRQAKKPRNWMRMALILSLAINLLIVGALVGAFAKNEKTTGRHLDRASMGLGAYILALPTPKQDEILSMIGKGSKDRREFRKNMKEFRRELDATLQAQPFSSQAVKNAMDLQRMSAIARTVKIQEAYLAALAEMSEEERAAHLKLAQEIKAKRSKKRRKISGN